jgi:ADP-ribose pyrophosphatase YjhB (NUDIX family)
MREHLDAQISRVLPIPTIDEFMGLAALASAMPGDGPFLFLRDGSSPYGFWHLPDGGMCLSAFLFVRQGSRILLGKYRDRPEWAELAGLEPDRVRRNVSGWTIPASQLKFGEDPRDAARRIGERILVIRGLRYSEPRVATELYEPSWLPGKSHYDVSFFVDATAPKGYRPSPPPWYNELAWHDPRTLKASAYARSHGDVIAMWRRLRTVRT